MLLEYQSLSMRTIILIAAGLVLGIIALTCVVVIAIVMVVKLNKIKND